MEAAINRDFSILQLRSMLRQATSVEEIRSIQAMFPTMTTEERAEGHRRLDDGIYDDGGVLIGERHPED